MPKRAIMTRECRREQDEEMGAVFHCADAGSPPIHNAESLSKSGIDTIRRSETLAPFEGYSIRITMTENVETAHTELRRLSDK